MNAAIRHYIAIQALARYAETRGFAKPKRRSLIGRWMTPHVCDATGYAALWLLAIGMGFLYGTAIGHAILEAIWSY